MPTTRFALMRTGTIWAVLGAAVAVFVVLLAVALLMPPGGGVSADTAITADASGGLLHDVGVYQRIVERVHFGENYYEAAHDELTANRFGTRSVFNWRTPLYLSSLALLPSREVAQAALITLTLVAYGFGVAWFWRVGGRAFGLLAALALFLNLGIVLAPVAVLFSELTAGILILLSASAYGVRQRTIGFVAGALALFVRELAGLYVLVCIWRAWRERAWIELGAWVVVLVGYAAFFAWHYQNVMAQIGPDDLGYQDSWIAFGGAAFVLATAAFNGVFTLLPLWATAAVLPIALIGVVGWQGLGWQRAVTAIAAYVAAFAVVGKAFNDYWGLLYTPLLMLALPWAIAAFRDIAVRLRADT